MKERNKKMDIIKSLPYLEYLPDSKLFILADKSLGVIYKLDTLDHEPMLFEDITNHNNSLQAFLDLPSNCVLQFYSQMSHISETDILEAGNLSWKTESQVANFFRQKRLEALIIRSKNGELLKRDTYFSIRFMPKKLSLRGFNFCPKLSNSFLNEIEEYEKDVEDFEKILGKLEAISKIKMERINGDDLRDCVRKSLFCANRQLAPINQATPLSEQILFSDIDCDQEGLCGKMYSRTVSLLAPGEYCEGDAVGFLNLDFPSVISLRITRPAQASILKTIGIKEWVTKNSLSPRAKSNCRYTRD